MTVGGRKRSSQEVAKDEDATKEVSHISLIYVQQDGSIQEHKVDVQKVLRESPKAELTSEEFQTRCLQLFIASLKTGKSKLSVDELQLYDLNGN